MVVEPLNPKKVLGFHSQIWLARKVVSKGHYLIFESLSYFYYSFCLITLIRLFFLSYYSYLSILSVLLLLFLYSFFAYIYFLKLISPFYNFFSLSLAFCYGSHFHLLWKAEKEKGKTEEAVQKGAKTPSREKV